MIPPIHNPKSEIHNPFISLMVAMSRNGVIGRNNRLPWRMPADLKRFKALTTDHAVIMGRKTFDSIGGKPLPGRTNIVISRNQSAKFDGAIAAHSLDHAIALAAQHDQASHGKNEVFILGGSEVFREALPKAARIYLTLIEADIQGDTFFPDIAAGHWRITEDEPHASDEKNAYPYRFQIFER